MRAVLFRRVARGVRILVVNGRKDAVVEFRTDAGMIDAHMADADNASAKNAHSEIP